MSMLARLQASKTGRASAEDKKEVTLDLKSGRRTFPIQEINISLITPDPDQPRKSFDPAAINELADDIRTRGQLQPIGVRKIGDDTYMLVFGERRFRALTLLQETIASCVVLDLSPTEILEAQIVENTKRQDFELLEIATGFARLAKMLGTIGAAAERISITNTLASQYMAIANAEPEVLALVNDGLTNDARSVYELTKLQKANPQAFRETVNLLRETGGQNIRSVVTKAAEAASPKKKSPQAGTVEKAKATPKTGLPKRPAKVVFSEHPTLEMTYQLTIDGEPSVLLDYTKAKQLMTDIERVIS